MNTNVGSVDRLVRVVLAVLAWWLAAEVGYGTVGGVVALIVLAVLALTSAIGYCPAYAVLRVTTRDGLHRVPTSR